MVEDPDVVKEVDRMMSSMGLGQLSDKANFVLSSARGMVSSFFGGKKRPSISR